MCLIIYIICFPHYVFNLLKNIPKKNSLHFFTMCQMMKNSFNLSESCQNLQEKYSFALILELYLGILSFKMFNTVDDY